LAHCRQFSKASSAQCRRHKVEAARILSTIY
jgi:hypothetical protein